MIYVLLDQDSFPFKTFDGPDIDISKKLKEWVYDKIGPEPNLRDHTRLDSWEKSRDNLSIYEFLVGLGLKEVPFQELDPYPLRHRE